MTSDGDNSHSYDIATEWGDLLLLMLIYVSSVTLWEHVMPKMMVTFLAAVAGYFEFAFILVSHWLTGLQWRRAQSVSVALQQKVEVEWIFEGMQPDVMLLRPISWFAILTEQSWTLPRGIAKT